MKLMYKMMFCGIVCFFTGCNNTEDSKMQSKIEKGFDGDISEEEIAKGFKGNNTARELRRIEKDAEKNEEKTQQDGIQEQSILHKY